MQKNVEAVCENVYSYADVRDYLRVHLINYAHNMEKIEDIPYVLVEDMAAVFYYAPVICGETSDHPELVTSENLKAWDVDLYTLYRDAVMASMNLAPAVLAPMKDLIGLSKEEAEDSFPMYVLSCRDARFGAAAVLYPEVLSNIAKGLHDSLYLIPSSVHEWIILLSKTIPDTDEVEAMIREINSTEVLPGEVLSDHLYYYDAKADRFGRAERKQRV